MLLRALKTWIAGIRQSRDPVGYARSIGVTIGQNCRLIHVSFGSEPYLVTLGDHVSATRTRFVTHDGGVWVFRQEHPELDLVAPIKVGSNVYFGVNVTVLPGVTIGDNVVIGAGAVVARDIPSDCVAVGVPAKPIKTMDEYWQSVSTRTVPTNLMNAEAKKEYYLRMFGPR